MTCPIIKQNEGISDRVIRVVIGSAALIAAYFWLSGIAQVIAYIIGVAALATGIIGFCGLYTLLGISTITTKKK